MPRLVRHDAVGPHEIKPQDKSVWVCMCGLSQNLPFCDDSHKTARQNEPPGKLCTYDRERRTIIQTQDDA